MSRGRPPKPPELHALEGNPSKRPIKQTVQLPGVPECPPFLTGKAAEHFKFVTGELSGAGIVRRLDTDSLAILATLWAAFWQADDAHRQAVAARDVDGMKEWRLQTFAALRGWTSLASKFGLTPADRLKLLPSVGKQTSDPTEDRFLKVFS